MSTRRHLTRAMSWALLAYSALSLSAALWLLITGWPLLSSPDLPARIAFWLCAANLLLGALVIPDKAVRGTFWPGLFSVRRESVQVIRRTIQFTHVTFWAGIVAFGIVYFASPGLLSPRVVRSVILAGAVFMLVFLPVVMGALATAGQHAIRSPRSE